MTSKGEPKPTESGPSPELASKVAFLCRPESYLEPTARVEPIETHMSWVFLTDRFAYKLKKPIRFGLVNMITLDSRRENSEAEVRWNRRLAPDVYLGTVPLGCDERGRFVLGRNVRVVDWLVKMRRLPAERMLDRVIERGDVLREDILRFAETLARFYHRAPAVEMSVETYRTRWVDGIREIASELEELYPVVDGRVQTISETLLRFLRRHEETFAARVKAKKIVEGHGDLRPEHVCLLAEPVVIDCVEFSSELRAVDPVDELSFLSVECRHAGGPPFVGEVLFESYRAATGDEPPPSLIDFYETYRAFVRARTSIWHLRDPNVEDPARWTAKASAYIELADRLARDSPGLSDRSWEGSTRDRRRGPW